MKRPVNKPSASASQAGIVPGKTLRRPRRESAEEAVRTLIRWAGDDPDREGLAETPSRVVRAFREWYSGYSKQPTKILNATFKEIGTYDDQILFSQIDFYSHCEHHMAPIIGVAHVGYLPRSRVIGVSKLARLVDLYAHRLQI